MKANRRGTGPITPLTRQPLKGRAAPGVNGLRFAAQEFYDEIRQRIRIYPFIPYFVNSDNEIN